MAKDYRLDFCFVLLGVVTLTASASAEPKTTCPPGQRPSVSGCIEGSRHAQIRTVGDAGERPSRTLAVPKPDVDSELDPLKQKRWDTARKLLLIQELQQLERVFAATPKNAPDRPNIIRRLAEGYAELEAISERERIEQELLAELAKRAEQAAVRGQAKDTDAPQPGRAAPKVRKRSTTVL
jgi:hypothetical protein